MGLALVTCMHNRVSVALAGLFLIFFYLHILTRLYLTRRLNYGVLEGGYVFRVFRPNRGSKLKKSSGRLLATNWRNIVARQIENCWYKFGGKLALFMRFGTFFSDKSKAR